MKKAAVISLSIGIGVMITAAIVTPTALLLQKKITLDVVKVDESSTFKNYKATTLKETGNNVSALERNIQAAKADWNSWIVPFNSDNIIVNDAIENVTNVDLVEINGSDDNFEIWFYVDWSSQYNIDHSFSKIIKGFYLNDVWPIQAFNWNDPTAARSAIQAIINDDAKRYTRKLNLENDLNTTSNTAMKALISPNEKIDDLIFSVEEDVDDPTKIQVSATIKPIAGWAFDTPLILGALTLNQAVSFTWTNSNSVITLINNAINSSESVINEPEGLKNFLKANPLNANIIAQINQQVGADAVDAINTIDFDVPTALNPARTYTIIPNLTLKPGFGFNNHLENLVGIKIKRGSFFKWANGVDSVQTAVQAKITSNVNNRSELQALINSFELKKLLSDSIDDPTNAIAIENNLKNVNYEVMLVESATPATLPPTYKIVPTPVRNADFPPPATALPTIEGLTLIRKFNVSTKAEISTDLENLITTNASNKDIYNQETLLNFLNGSSFQNILGNYFSLQSANPLEDKTTPNLTEVVEKINFSVEAVAGNANTFKVSSMVMPKTGFAIGTNPSDFNVTINELVEVSFKNSAISFLNSEISTKKYTSSTQLNEVYLASDGIGYTVFRNQLQTSSNLLDDSVFKTISFESKLVGNSQNYFVEANFETQNGFTNVNPNTNSKNKLILNGIEFSQPINISWKNDVNGAKTLIQNELQAAQIITTSTELQAFLNTAAGKDLILEQINALLDTNAENAFEQIDVSLTQFKVTKTSAANVWPEIVTVTPEIILKPDYGFTYPIVELPPLTGIVLNHSTSITWKANHAAIIQNLIFNQKNVTNIATLNQYLSSMEFKNAFLNSINVIPNGSSANSTNVVKIEESSFVATANHTTPETYSITPTIVLNSGYKLSGSMLAPVTGMRVNTVVTATWNVGMVSAIIQTYINETSNFEGEEVANRIDTKEKLESKLNSDNVIQNSLISQISTNPALAPTPISSISFSVLANGASYKIVSRIALANGFVINNANLPEILNINLVREFSVTVGNQSYAKISVQEFINMPDNAITDFDKLRASANTGEIRQILEEYIIFSASGITVPEAANILFITTEIVGTPNTYKIEAKITANPGFVRTQDPYPTFIIEGITL